MYSGNPDPANDLKLIIEKKRSQPQLNCEIVSEASRWLKSELKGADIEFTYLSCDSDHHYGYSLFLINHITATHQMALSVKIAETSEIPQAFCEIVISGESNSNSFPLISEIASEKGKRQLLHFIADFVLSLDEQGYS